MIFLAWSCFLALSTTLMSAQAFMSDSNPAYTYGMTSYEPSSSLDRKVDSASTESNNITRVLLIQFETDAFEKGGSLENRGMDNGPELVQSPLDPWSIVWYIGSFGGLVAFFLIVSCSEWCCRRGARPVWVVTTSQRNEVMSGPNPNVTETPPPPYHLFAPPSYDSVNYADKPNQEKPDIYVIQMPMQAAVREQAPV